MLTAVRHAIECKVTLGPAVSRTFMYKNISVSFCDFSVHVHVLLLYMTVFPRHTNRPTFSTQLYIVSATKDGVVPNDCCVL